MTLPGGSPSITQRRTPPPIGRQAVRAGQSRSVSQRDAQSASYATVEVDDVAGGSDATLSAMNARADSSRAAASPHASQFESPWLKIPASSRPFAPATK